MSSDNSKCVVRCGICKEKFNSKERGKVDCCDHVFCSTCIGRSVIEDSRCPVCRKEIKTITSNGGGVKHVEQKRRVVSDDPPPLEDVPPQTTPFGLENLITFISHQLNCGPFDGLINTLEKKKEKTLESISFIEENQRTLEIRKRVYVIEIESITKQLEELYKEKEKEKEKKSCTCGRSTCPDAVVRQRSQSRRSTRRNNDEDSYEMYRGIFGEPVQQNGGVRIHHSPPPFLTNNIEETKKE